MFAEHYTTTIGPIEITVAPSTYPPCNVEVIVEEQDTSLLLGEIRVIQDTVESYDALIGKMQLQTPLVPGEVLIKHTTPRRFIAIIYAINRRPICRQEWIATALARLLREMETYQTRNIAMPLLGVTHGHFPATEFMQLLCATLPAVQNYPEKIWLITPMAEYRHIIRFLEDLRV